MRPLEKRLALVARWATSYSLIADIGAGSGRLSKTLASTGHTVIATEFGPEGFRILKSACQGWPITVLKGDGLDPLKVRGQAVDLVVVAGMGAKTIAAILSSGTTWLGAFAPDVIVQPMQGIGVMHAFILTAGYAILKAALLKDRGHFYATWLIRPSSVPPATGKELLIPREFSACPAYSEYIEREYARKVRRLAFLSSGDEHDRLRQEVMWLKEEKGGLWTSET